MARIDWNLGMPIMAYGAYTDDWVSDDESIPDKESTPWINVLHHPLHRVILV
jgi:hypothetical protein